MSNSSTTDSLCKALSLVHNNHVISYGTFIVSF